MKEVTMLEYLKDYKNFREAIREVKIEQFEELKDLLDENDKLKRELANIKSEHERAIMSLTHQITLERERFALEMKTKEAEQSKLLVKERGEFMEKNFSDMERLAEKRHEAVMDVLNAVTSRISDKRSQIDVSTRSSESVGKGEKEP